MGFFGRIASSIGSGVRRIGEFGGAALSKIGQIKTLYDKVNNATDGIIGETLTRLPVVGPVLAHFGNLLNNRESMTAISNGLRTANGIGDKVKSFGAGH